MTVARSLANTGALTLCHNHTDTKPRTQETEPPPPPPRFRRRSGGSVILVLTSLFWVALAGALHVGSTATFSTMERKFRSKGDRKSTEVEEMLSRTFDEAIMTHLYPRSEVNIFVQILQADGGTQHSLCSKWIVRGSSLVIPRQPFFVNIPLSHHREPSDNQPNPTHGCEPSCPPGFPRDRVQERWWRW